MLISYTVNSSSNSVEMRDICMAFGYKPVDRWPGFDSLWGKRFFFNPHGPERSWSPPGLLRNGYRGLFTSEAKAAGSWYWPLAPFTAQVKKRGTLLPFPPTYLPCVVVSYLNTGPTVTFTFFHIGRFYSKDFCTNTHWSHKYIFLSPINWFTDSVVMRRCALCFYNKNFVGFM
jgi:hypothetical protein